VFSVVRLCHCLGVSPSGYYDWVNRPLSSRAQADAKLLPEIRRVFHRSRQTYGYPRVHAELNQCGIPCSRHQVARLMRHNGIVAKMKARSKSQPIMKQLYAGEGNRLLDRGPTEACNEVWVADFTHIKTRTSWFYLAVVMDRHSRRILGWAMSHERTAKLTGEALRMAIYRRGSAQGILFHSDRGIEYVAHEIRDILAEVGMQRSLSRKGNCYDNAHMESFFHSLKTEMVYYEDFRSMEEGMRKLKGYIGFYNHTRLHSSLGYRTPAQFEAEHG
jgi:putative transposase